MIKFDKNEFLKPQIYSTLDEYETRCNVTKEIIEEIEQLQKENQQLKEQLQQKEDIINEITNYCKFQIEKEQDKFPKPLESEGWLKGRISAFSEILEMKCIRDINKYQKDQEDSIDLLLNKLQQKEDTINKAKEELYIWGEALFPEFQKKMLKILDNKGE